MFDRCFSATQQRFAYSSSRSREGLGSRLFGVEPKISSGYLLIVCNQET